MFRPKKNKNLYGTFSTGTSKYKKFKRFSIAILIVVIFVFGAGLYIFGKKNKTPQVQSAMEQTSATQIPGWWYQQYFGSSVCTSASPNWNICNPDADPDKDGLTNAQEFYYHTDPLNTYTVGDKLNDGQLVANGFDPSKPGHVLFDQATSDISVLGESLAFNTDAAKAFSQVIDLSNVKVPDINPIDLKVNNNNSKALIVAYLSSFKQIVDQNFPQSISDTITNAVQNQDQEPISAIILASQQTLAGLKTLVVPSDALALHKDYIGILSLLPSVVNIPDKSEIEDPTSQSGNAWFDDTQSFMYLLQQSGIEIQKLNTEYK